MTHFSMPKKTLPFALALLSVALGAADLRADPLSKRTDVDFYRDITSRELHGLATRSDGRLVGGPVMTDLKGQAPSPLLWCLEPEASGKVAGRRRPGGPDFSR